MQNTTLCYIECNGSFLLMHRVALRQTAKKEHDANAGKWIGIGGHMEEGESPEECAMREIKEETGLEVKASEMRYCGIVTFASDECEGEYMHLFHILLGNTPALPPVPPCDEGELQWVDIADMDALPQWEGDKIFLRLMRQGGAKAPDFCWRKSRSSCASGQGAPFFSLKLVYKGSHLASATLNGAPYPLGGGGR